VDPNRFKINKKNVFLSNQLFAHLSHRGRWDIEHRQGL